MAIVTIDFEASCLPRHGRSFPIEVGIADMHGRSRAWLIRPHLQWQDWDWTQEAQALHGISREQLYREGLPVEIVVRELRQALAGHRVVADSPIDAYWFEVMTGTAGMPPFVQIDHIGHLFDEIGSTSEDILAAQDVLDREPFRRHRAADDALWLIALIEMVMEARDGRRGADEIPPWRCGRSAFGAGSAGTMAAVV